MSAIASCSQLQGYLDIVTLHLYLSIYLSDVFIIERAGSEGRQREDEKDELKTLYQTIVYYQG